MACLELGKYGESLALATLECLPYAKVQQIEGESGALASELYLLALLIRDGPKELDGRRLCVFIEVGCIVCDVRCCIESACYCFGELAANRGVLVTPVQKVQR